MNDGPLLDLSASTFESAARAALQVLHQRYGFNLWMVTRTEGNDWIVLQAEDHGYRVEKNTVFRWSDSFCSRMVRGLGPRIAPDSNSVAAYREAPIGRAVNIAAYVGVPIVKRDGSLFGTLCAIDTEAQPPELAAELPFIELVAALLSSILNLELSAGEAQRRAERAEADAESDPLTGLYNRRGWERLIEAEEARCRMYGHPAAIISIDLDGLKELNDSCGHHAGDKLIRAAALAIRAAALDCDIVARIGGDEFIALLPEQNEQCARATLARMREALETVNSPASLGLAMRHPATGFEEAILGADREMYRDKAFKRSYQPCLLLA